MAMDSIKDYLRYGALVDYSHSVVTIQETPRWYLEFDYLNGIHKTCIFELINPQDSCKFKNFYLLKYKVHIDVITQKYYLIKSTILEGYLYLIVPKQITLTNMQKLVDNLTHLAYVVIRNNVEKENIMLKRKI